VSSTGASTPVNSGNGVADAALTDTTGPATINGAEGNTLNNVIIATFDDANPSAPLADYTLASVSYTGSPTFIGTPSYQILANGAPSGGFAHWKVVASNLTFAEAGTYTVSAVKINDEGGSSLTTASGNTTFVIADAGLTDTTPSNSTVSATEGNGFTNLLLMTFDDANPSATASDFSVTSVSYTGAPTFTSGPSYQVLANGAASGGFSHWKVVVSGTVAEKGNYTATVNVADTDGKTASSSNTTLAVADAALSDTTPAQGTVNGTEGNALTNVVIATFDDANPSATAADFPAGNISVSYTGAPSFIGTPTYQVMANGAPSGGVSHWKVIASGTFSEEGNFGVNVTVTDVDGNSTSTSNTTFAVSDQAVVATAGASINAVENGSTGLVVLATFTDPAGPEAL
ncbi:MAG TPA: hypothetical protein VKJ07_16005, partial [Mycobacteriales bacterium]|nr:hypothetical protein [Mycobacteriales bacterium]